MRKQSLLKLLGLFLMLALLLFAVSSAFAQEGEGAAEETTEEAAAVEGEGEEAPSVSPLTPLGINGGFLIAQIINFGIIFVFLLALMWRPMINMLDSRSAKIAKGLEDASAAAKARQNAEAEAEKILAGARAEVAKLLEEGRGRGDELAKTIESAARTDADKIREDARTEAASARDAELAGMRDQVLAISMAVAQRLIGENLDEKKQKALVDDFFTKVPADAKSLSGAVEITSAMPLSDSEQAKAKKEIGASDVTFKVDPAILGGLVVRAGDRVIDGSVRSNLSNLAGRLN